jgi:hypothetical protein
MIRQQKNSFLIIKDRVEIYKDFAINLLNYIHHYYIDKESLFEDSDIKNHFNWCYNKVCDEFLKEEIDFKNNAELREFYYNYYYNQFYKIKEGVNQDTSLEYFEKFWEEIFNFTKQKNRNLISILYQIYTICDKSVNIKNSVVELI